MCLNKQFILMKQNKTKNKKKINLKLNNKQLMCK